MLSVRLFVVLVLLGGGVCAQTSRVSSKPPQYREVSLTELIRNPDVYSGQRVTLTADILSLSANSRSLDLYDGLSRAMISVSLVNLKKSERRALMQTPVHRLSVSGWLNLERGQVVIQAERVEARLTERVAAL